MSEYPPKPYEGRIPPRPDWLPANVVLDESVPEFVLADGSRVPAEHWLNITTPFQRWELIAYLQIVKHGWEAFHAPIAHVMQVIDLSTYDDKSDV
jgi:hypothetical protein